MKILTFEIAQGFVDENHFIDWIEDVNDLDLVCEISGETDVSKLCILREVE